MYKIIFLLGMLIMVIALSVQAQYFNQTSQFLKANSVWAFGNGCGLDFNSGIPIPITTALVNNTEGSSSVSDSMGNLLFYIGNKGVIYDRNHTPMPNGTGIYPSSHPYASSTQGALIVPVIDTPWKYYAFTNMADETYKTYKNNPQPPYLAYSVIDMTLNNGLGDVEPGRKNIALESVDWLSEALIAIPGENCDLWLLTYVTSPVVPPLVNGFKAWHITVDGIDSNPVISNQPFNGSIQGSHLAVSPDRQKIALTLALIDDINLSSGTILCRFDPLTGKVFDSIFLERRSLIPPILKLGTTSVCFSPDNSKLYHAIYQFLNGFIEQLDISSYNLTSIESSAYRVDSGMGLNLGLKLYNDTIYIVSWKSGTTSSQYLSKIVNPNVSGQGCGFEYQSITLPSVHKASCLPNQIVFPPDPKEFFHTVLPTYVCRKKNIVLNVSDSFLNYQWDNGDTLHTRSIDTPGIYWVRYKNNRYTNDRCQVYVDTFAVALIELDPAITVDGFDLSTTIPYSSYQWFLNGLLIPGATDRVYSVTENGDYTVVVSDENYCTDTSDMYKVTNWTSIADGYTLQQRILIYPNPASELLYIQSPDPIDAYLCGMDGRVLIHVPHATKVRTRDLPNGLYLLKITDSDGRFIKVEKINKE